MGQGGCLEPLPPTKSLRSNIFSQSKSGEAKKMLKLAQKIFLNKYFRKIILVKYSFSEKRLKICNFEHIWISWNLQNPLKITFSVTRNSKIASEIFSVGFRSKCFCKPFSSLHTCRKVTDLGYPKTPPQGLGAKKCRVGCWAPNNSPLWG